MSTNPRCWPGTTFENVIRPSTRNPAAFDVVCSCGEWQEKNVGTLDDAVAALSQHRGDPPPHSVPAQREAGGDDATGG